MSCCKVAVLALAGVSLAALYVLWRQRYHRRCARFAYEIGQPVKKEKKMPLDLSITNEEKVRVSLHPVTNTGRPVSLDGPATWSVLSGESTVEVEPDGLSGFLISSDNLGDTLVQIEADADLGEGVVTIMDTILLHVIGALATNLGLTAEAPVSK